MNNLISRSLALLAAIASLASLRAEPLTFTLDPARSSITLSGSASGADLQAQAPGSLTTTFEGTVVLDVGVAEVRFPGGSRVVPQELNSWQPGLAGVDGSAPASYGGKAQIGSGFFGVTAVAATRRLSFELLSLPLPFANGSFNAEGLQFQFIETNNPALDYRTSGLVNRRDSQILSGLATNKLAGASTLVTVGTVQTLTIPVDASYPFTLLLPDDSVLRLAGQIVATRTVPDGPPSIVIEEVTAAGMKLSWPSGFKLQKSSQFQNPVWSDTGTPSPATIPFASGGEYFQVVPQ